MKTYRPSRFWPALILFILAICLAFYYPLPYFISSPGKAIELRPIITVEDRTDENGTFMLTTIRMAKANMFNYSYAKWDEYRDTIPKETLLAHYRDEEEYSERQLLIMQSSQDTAITVAYRLAGKEINVLNQGVMVVNTVEHMPADKYFTFGDIITHVDNKKMNTSEELIAYITTKQIGDEVRVKFKRANEVQEASIQLASLPLTEEEKTENEQPRAGIGIMTVTKQQIEANPPVEIHTESIGGPSAGLMFTLEIYNQLTKEDMTKGYRIAGTGTISPDGTVGRIGGIHQKIVAADKAKAEIFFAPNENGAIDSNYNRAVEAAKDIETAMKIVPVDTVHDALQYLESLPPKENDVVP